MSELSVVTAMANAAKTITRELHPSNAYLLVKPFFPEVVPDFFSSAAVSPSRRISPPEVEEVKKAYEVTAKLHEPGFANRLVMKGPILPESAEEVVNKLHETWQGYLKKDGTPDPKKLAEEPLHFQIFSPGGAVPSAFRIIQTMDHLKEKGLKIITYVEEMAASAAMSIFVHGSERVASPTSGLMVHEISAPYVAPYYPITPLISHVNYGKHVNDLLIKDLHEQMRLEAPNPITFEELKQTLKTDQYLTAKEAKETYGWVDRYGIFNDIRYKPPKPADKPEVKPELLEAKAKTDLKPEVKPDSPDTKPASPDVKPDPPATKPVEPSPSETGSDS